MGNYRGTGASEGARIAPGINDPRDGANARGSIDQHLAEVVDLTEPTPEQLERAIEQPHRMRGPCRFCGEPDQGTISAVNGQNVVRCAACGRAVYNAPRTETAERQRSAMTVHNGIKPRTHATVMIRANRRCELCGQPAAGTEGLMVDHMLSVDDGLKLGLTEAQLNHIENLAALCPACNLGKGRTTLPLYLVLAILKARTGGDGDQ